MNWVSGSAYPGRPYPSGNWPKAIWGADEAYQAYFSDAFLNTYLLFWDNHIVEITFYWEPTTEQIAQTAEILQQANN